VRTCTENGLSPSERRDTVNHVLALQGLPEIAHRICRDILHRRSIWPVELVDGEILIVAEGVELRVGEEAGMVDGATMVEYLDQGIVFVCLRGVVDVDEAVGASGKKRLV